MITIDGKRVISSHGMAPKKTKGIASCFDLHASFGDMQEHFLQCLYKNKIPKGITKNVEFYSSAWGTVWTFAELKERLEASKNVIDEDYIANTIHFIKTIDRITMPPNSRCLIQTGVHIQLEEGFDSKINPRSGLGLKGVFCIDGTIDNDYTGDLGVNLVVLGSAEENFDIVDLDRIAQLRICQTFDVDWEDVDKLDETERGADGFNSTGVSAKV